jgi:hypothetical protein
MITVSGAPTNKILGFENLNLAIISRSATGQAGLIKRHFAADCIGEFGIAPFLRRSQSPP